MSLGVIPEVQIDAELCRRNFYYFIQQYWHIVTPEEPVYNWHIEYIANELQSVSDKVVQRLPKDADMLINIPPGTSKSTICTIMFPVWLWVIDPTLRIMTTSYSASLSTDHAVKSRDIIKSDKFMAMFPTIRIKDDQDNKMHYKNELGGERYTTSTGGTVTGFHAHVIVVDDPVNPQEALSVVKRKEAVGFIDTTLSTRKVNKESTVTILLMQRLHEQDPSGHWLSKSDKKIKHICLPGEVSNDVKPIELKDRYRDGLLDPIRLSRSSLQQLRVDLGSYGYAGQIMQRPAPDEGGILKKNFFSIITKKDFDLKAKDKKVVWDFFLDTAYTGKQSNDPSALMSVCIIDNCAYIKRSHVAWLEFPELINEIKLFATSQGYTNQSRIFVEPKATGLSVVQVLKKETGLNIIALDPPKDDKLTRVHSASPVIEAKRVILIEGDWNNSFIDECAAFPNGLHDDQVDNISAMVNKFLSKPVITMVKGRAT